MVYDSEDEVGIIHFTRMPVLARYLARGTRYRCYRKRNAEEESLESDAPSGVSGHLLLSSSILTTLLLFRRQIASELSIDEIHRLSVAHLASLILYYLLFVSFIVSNYLVVRMRRSLN